MWWLKDKGSREPTGDVEFSLATLRKKVGEGWFEVPRQERAMHDRDFLGGTSLY